MKITIAGGDERMLVVAEMFKEAGYVCEKIGFGKSDVSNALKNTSVVIFPFPYCKGKNLNALFSERDIPFDEISSLINDNVLLLGGNLPEISETRIDYAKDEKFLTQNAKITAEGAISIAMNISKTTLCGTSAVVLGYGRIGVYLTELLRSLGVKVFVVARKNTSRLQAELSGAKAVGFEDIDVLFREANFVFNTIPFPIVNQTAVCSLKQNTPFIDLASLPGGLTEDAEKVLGERYIHALGLPGKYAPETAGRVIFETVFEILQKKGVAV